MALEITTMKPKAHLWKGLGSHVIDIYYINTNEIPVELTRENLIS